MDDDRKSPNLLVPLAATLGSLRGRFLAYLLDIVIITIITIIFYIVVGFLGIITFGFAWAAFALPGTVIAIFYSAITIASPSQGTLGMRMVGVRLIDAYTGQSVSLTQAAVHALLFYVCVASVLLTVIDIAFGLFRADSRLGRDLIVNLIAVRV